MGEELSWGADFGEGGVEVFEVGGYSEFGEARDCGGVGGGYGCAGGEVGGYVWVCGEVEAWRDDDGDAGGENEGKDGGQEEGEGGDCLSHVVLTRLDL